MSDSTTSAANLVTKFKEDFFVEYVRGNTFAPYMGTQSNNPIVMVDERQKYSVPLIARLSGAGVTGNSTLDGNEEDLADYAYVLTPTYIRNGFRVSKEEAEKPAYDIMMAGKEACMNWGMERVRDDIVKALGSLNNGAGSTADVTTASAATINTVGDVWVANNSDRVLYGAAVSNYSASDHSASLANVDASGDKMTGDIVRLARKIARTANPMIRPIKLANGRETYVLFCGTTAFIHLQEDLETLHSHAGVRGEGNPLFMPGDLYWDNVVIREVPEISTLLANASYYATAGASSIKVEPFFLCGAQAVGYGLGQRPDIKVDKLKDYGFKPGVACELKHDIDKLQFNLKDHGVVSGFVVG